MNKPTSEEINRRLAEFDGKCAYPDWVIEKVTPTVSNKYCRKCDNEFNGHTIPNYLSAKSERGLLDGVVAKVWKKVGQTQFGDKLLEIIAYDETDLRYTVTMAVSATPAQIALAIYECLVGAEGE